MTKKEKSGVNAALAQMDVPAHATPEAVQLTLDALLPDDAIPHPEGQEGQVLDAGEDGGGADRAGPGRPPGATNLATRQMADFLDRQYTNPLVTLSKIAHVDPFELVREVRRAFPQIDAERVLSFWKECALSIMPYRAKKQPVAVDVTGKGSFSLILEDPAPEGRSDDEAAEFAALAGVEIQGQYVEEKTAENSQKSLPGPEKSDGAKSDGPAKCEENSQK